MEQESEAEIVKAEFVTPGNQGSGFFNRLLSKRSLDMMMFTGGGLLVAGFAVWLWSIGIFENAMVLAASVGAANLLLVGAGLWMMTGTYRFTGRGILLLGSLVLPLNLWLYHSQELITIDSGYLWLPALIISAIYAGVARASRDPVFVFSFVGGVLLTGVLFAAGIAPTFPTTSLLIATLTVVVGAICIHVETLFPNDYGDFSKLRFGAAFFHSGILALVAGLAVLFGGQEISLFNEFFGIGSSSQLLDSAQTKFWSLGILIATVYTSVFSYFNQGRNWIVVTLGLIASGWALLIGCDLMAIEMTFDLAVIVVGGLVVTANFLQRVLVRQIGELTYQRGHALAFTALAVLTFGASSRIFLLTNQLLLNPAANLGANSAHWPSIIQLLVGSLGLLTIPGLWKQPRDAQNSVIAIAALGTVWGVQAALANFSVLSIGSTFLIASTIPVALTALVLSLRDRGNRETVLYSLISTTAVLALGWLLATLTPEMSFISTTSIILIAILLACNSGAAFLTGNRASGSLAALFSTLLFSQLLVRFDFPIGYSLTLGLSIAGIIAVIASKALIALKTGRDELGKKAHQVGNNLVALGSSGAILFTASSVIAKSAEFDLVALLVAQLVCIGFTALNTKALAWRQTFLGLAILTVLSAFVAANSLFTLSLWQKIEIGALAYGTLLTIAGYIGWSKENGERNNFVSFNLFTGSLMLMLPMAIGLISNRFFGTANVDAWRYIHEIGGFVIALFLLGSGIVTQVRSTTLSGATLLMVFVFSNLLLINFPEQLQQTSVLMMIGGGTFFGVAILLSLYREKLIALPEKIKEGKGIFKVLKWR